MMKHALSVVGILAVLALVAAPVAAQSSGGVRGKVVDENNEPVADANVLIEFDGGVTRKYEVTTNDKGEYMQLGMGVGPYRITAAKEGYVSSAMGVRIGLGISGVPVLALKSHAAAAQQSSPDAEAIRAKFDEGVALAQAGKLDEAEVVYQEILVDHPGIAGVYQNLGYIYAQKKDWVKAEESYLSALDLRPGEPSYVTALAKVYQESGQEEKATALVAQAAADNPQDAATQLNQGIFQLNEGKTAEAQASFEAALAADPDMAEAHYHLGTIKVGQGKVDEAVEHLEKYIASNPKNEQYAATAQGLVQALKQ